ncbi:hypothetical protein J2X47_001481 [Sphingomonas sp. BE270]|jgi:hypothetical protein|nr:hypothetical protein [Sphingomonas sp. BE137]MDR7257310.1 hypothetical protein [Sphingomonas sp. BE270]
MHEGAAFLPPLPLAGGAGGEKAPSPQPFVSSEVEKPGTRPHM